ncbi:TonB family protein [Porphyromonas sp. COT-239 OH1446]|uniref:TonB family protein n=1 Tax=Porphyromonas sp. COT-239 OH1446 TaxID=1515613 RepID=UPI00052DD394|nr:TonB family protein [Porphyromonas sp. COT-239 OH1446]KGN71355.1 hypothetical protein HQ37_02595 [Porphyromonas sp. COT-239 OH1446]
MSKPLDPRLRSRLIALGITLMLHALLVFMLYQLHLESSLPQPPAMEELVVVNLGDLPSASGKEEPEGKKLQEESPEQSAAPAQPTPEANPNPKPTKPTAPEPKPQMPANQRQSIEPTIKAEEERAQQLRLQQAAEQARAEAEAKAKAEAERRARLEREAAEAKAKAEAERKAKEAERRRQIGQSVAGAFAGKASNSSTQGTDTTGAGNQGESKGSSDSYSLTGRTITSFGGVPTRPKTNRAITGVINVSITVNASGRVIDASVNPQGTNIADPAIRSAAIAAAKATQFNAVPNATEQRGSIKYRFVQ